MAYMKKHCSGCCSGCNNGYAQADCAYGYSTRGGCGCNQGCSSCNHHSCGSCSSCNSGCSSCRSRGSGRNGFGTLRSVTGPFSNCGNWWSNNDPCFPYYTGPCRPCDPCGNCCCPDWPWPPMPPLMPVNYGYGYPCHSGYYGRGDDYGHCNHYAADGYTSNKNCYRTEASSHEACAARKVKPIVEYHSHSHGCDDDC